MNKLIFLVLCIFMAQKASAQYDKNMDLSKRLSIEQTVPDLPEMPILNFSNNTVDLDTYRDKLVILDFWDTSCSTCIALMPHLKELQKTLGDKVQILTVTWESREAIESFFKKSKYLKEKNTFLPTIVGDTLLRKYFPHLGVPHSVYLYKGKVKAITHSDYIKVEYIEKLLADGKLDIPVKDDFNTKVIMQDTDKQKVIGKVLVTGYQEGLVFKGGLPIEKDSLSGQFITYINNSGILSAYTVLFAQIKMPDFIWHPDRIIWKVKDKIKYEAAFDERDMEIWTRKYGICYQRISQDTLPKAEMAKLVIKDLNFFLGLNVRQTKVEKDVIVIRKTDRSRAGATEVPEQDALLIEGANNVAFFTLDMTAKFPPAIDESGYTGLIKLRKFSTIEELSTQLLFYGLEAVKTKREIDVLIIEEIE